jgi:hypothetical protein
MAVYGEGRGIAVEAEPFGLLTEGAAGIAAIVLAIIALAGIAAAALGSITAIIIGVGLMVQAFNAAAEVSREFSAGETAVAAAGRGVELGGEVMIDIAAGLAGIVLGILGLVGVNAPQLIPAALIVFGGALILSGAIAAQGRASTTTTGSGAPVAMSGLQMLVGFAAAILGILSLISASSWVLVLAGFIVVGAALLIVSATFSAAVVRLVTAATA